MVTCAYLAGIADGEGCFGITRWVSYGRYYYAANFRIAMVTYEIPALFCRYGGNFMIQKPGTSCARPGYIWHCSEKSELTTLLKSLLPFLRLKKAHAYRLLEFLETVSSSRQAVSNQNNMLRKELFEELRELNRRGRTN